MLNDPKNGHLALYFGETGWKKNKRQGNNRDHPTPYIHYSNESHFSFPQVTI